MASSLFLFPVPVKLHRYRPVLRKYNRSAPTTDGFMSFGSSSSCEINLHRSFPLLKRNSAFSRCYAASSPSEPPPEDRPPPSSGVSPNDALQIFFSVLFWMSLFFWSCAWDQGNNGRRNKDSKFWK